MGEFIYNHFNIIETIHFDNEYDIQMSYENYEAGGYKHELELAIILNELHVLHPTRSRCSD